MEAIPLCIPDNFSWDHTNSKVHVRKDQCRKRLTVCQEAIDFLKSIQKPVIVICIIGPARSGKSFFLSQLQRNVSFKVGNSNVSKTVGIWIGSNREIVMRNGEENEIILLDCEGTGAVKTSDDYSTRDWDTKLMTLAMLSSSFFIYNSKECPNAVDLENLHFVSSLSNVILHNFADSENIKAWLDIDFYWLLRDVMLEPEVDGVSCDWRKFLRDEILCTKKQLTDDYSYINSIKMAITNTFSRIDAYGIETPTSSRKILRSLKEFYHDDPSLKEFREDFEKVGKHIITSAKVKKFNGNKLTGYDLANWVQEFVEELNKEEKSLDINGTWEITFATKEAYKVYCNEMKKVILPCDNQIIDNLHSDMHHRALELFSSIAKMSSVASKAHKSKHLEMDLKEMLISIHEKNKKATLDHCRSVTETLKAKHIDPIDDNSQITVKSMYTSIANFFQEFDKSCKGNIFVITKERERIGAEINHRALQMEESVENLSRNYSLRNYVESMKGLELPCRENDLMAYHTKYSKVAMEMYDKRVSGSKTLDLNNARCILKESMDEMKRDTFSQNQAKSLSQCQKLVSDLKATHIKPMIDSLENHTYKELHEKRDKVLRLYKKGAKGPSALIVEEKAFCDLAYTIQNFQKEMAIQAKNKAIKNFESTINLTVEQQMPCSEEMLISAWDTARECALDIFDKKTECIQKDVVDSLREPLIITFRGELRRLKSYNVDKSSVYCTELIVRLEEKHFQKETASFAELMCSDLTNAYNSIFEEYDLEAKGPEKDTVREKAVIQLNEKIRRVRRKKYVIQGAVFLTTGLVGSALFNAGLRTSKAIRRT